MFVPIYVPTILGWSSSRFNVVEYLFEYCIPWLKIHACVKWNFPVMNGSYCFYCLSEFPFVVVSLLRNYLALDRLLDIYFSHFFSMAKEWACIRLDNVQE